MRFNAVVTLALLMAVAFVCAPPAHAGTVISTCDEPSLDAAVAAGGTVTFACSGTITVTSTITISSDTTIDGTGHDLPPEI
jgi:hypothetical protein